MLNQAIHDLVFKRDSTRLTNLLNLTDSVRKDKAIQVIRSLLPLRLTPEGTLKWIKDKSKLQALQLPDTTSLNDGQKEGLCKRLEQALRHLGIAITASDSLSLRLRRLMSDAALTVRFGNDAKLAENFFKFCRDNSALIRPQNPTVQRSRSIPEKSEFWLDSSERTVSVHTISGGIPDSDRRKH